MRRNAISQWDILTQPLQLVFAEILNGFPAIRTTGNGTNSENNNVD
jgi:hypothetical protein